MARQFLFNPYILNNLPIPSTGFDVVQDTAEPRLRMYVTNRGVKSFFVRKRVNGKDKRIIIGKYPDIEISDARDRVNDVLKSASEKPKLHRKKTGFRKIADVYLVKKVRRSDESKAKLVRSMIKHLSPLFDKSVQDITTLDVSETLANIQGAAVRNRVHELLHSIFNFAVDGGYITSNPAANVPKIKEQRRVRPLTKSGFDRLLSAINKEKSRNLRAAFLMLIYGFAPKSKIFSMTWRDLDFNHYTWKGRPLSDAAVVLLQDLPQDGKWVFPGRGGRHLTDPRMAWKAIAMRAKIPNLTMDDVYKYLTRQLTWHADRESFRMNMNNLIDSIIM
ncbi:MAG: integrase arm-type DNA-binding domain-containing protein [Rickettsiales bacterium]|jgi:integrase|nr:integrase arm-type DNA-binding domain-containing protein [Rickettsiales bacterium]